jgi:hypothetical protein
VNRIAPVLWKVKDWNAVQSGKNGIALKLLLELMQSLGQCSTKSLKDEMSETHSRTIARTVSYRLVALLITALWTGLGEAVAIHFVLAIVQYTMERVWLRVKWGKQ